MTDEDAERWAFYNDPANREPADDRPGLGLERPPYGGDNDPVRCDRCDRVLRGRVFMMSRILGPGAPDFETVTLCSRRCVAAQLEWWEPTGAKTADPGRPAV